MAFIINKSKETIKISACNILKASKEKIATIKENK